MFDRPRRPRPVLLGSLGLLLAAWGCGDALTLPPAQIPVAQQQIHIYALEGTPAATPSAYNMVGLAQVRVDQSNNFDFAFNIGPDSVFGLGTTGDTIAVLLPRGAMGFVEDGGLQTTPIAFDSLLLAPDRGYEKRKPTRIRAGDAVFAASRLQTCNFGFIRPHYAKLQIQSIDLVTRSAVILVIIDPNCGYRGLGTGIPTQ